MTKTNDIHLRSMTKEEFEVYFLQLRARLIHDGMKAYRIAEDDAKKIVEIDLTEIAPKEFETENSRYFTILCQEKNIGSLWLTLRGETEKQTPYLTDLFISPEFRSQGIGKKVLSLIELELKSRGITNNIAVHIVGDFNESAIKLFKSAGYFTTTIKMEKMINI